MGFFSFCGYAPFLRFRQATGSAERSNYKSYYIIERMAWRQISLPNKRSILSTGFAQFSSKSNPYPVKVGIPEFLNGVGNGVEQYSEKLESEFGDLNKLLVTRGLKLKKLGVGGKYGESGDKACKHRKLILKFSHKYRLGLWRP